MNKLTVFTLGMIAMFALVIIIGWSGADEIIDKSEAVKQGHAEYYLDANHDRQWRWLPKGDNLITTSAGA